jgi:hypothetical protein
VFRLLDEPEAWALQTFNQQQTFSVVCSGLNTWFTQAQIPMQAAQYLQQWIRCGLVIEIVANN